MKKILLFDTAFASANTGDTIILNSIEKAFSPLFDASMVFRLGTHIINYSAIQLLVPNQKIRDTNLNADLKFIGGTNLIQDNLLKLRPQFMLNPFNTCLYKDAVLVSVGRNKDFSSFSNFYTKELYKRTFSHNYYHSTRDESTRELLESIGYKAINTGCSTLWGITKEHCRAIPVKKAEQCVFTVSGNRKHRSPSEDKRMIEIILKKYGRVHAWIQTASDLDYLRQLTDIEKNDISCIFSLKKYSDLLDAGNIDYIGTRLHGGCFAIQHKVRSVIISIDQRTEGIHKANNIPILPRAEIDSLAEMIDQDMVTDIVVDHESINKFLSQFVQ